MDYFSILSLDREPFSNSPDPAYFYHSRQHVDCLQKLEIALRLRRGLNVVVGNLDDPESEVSQLIDKGDPTSPYSLEPSPNGCQANLGAYGNTD